MTETPKWALDEIEKVRKHKLPKLILKDTDEHKEHLKGIPTEVSELTHLREFVFRSLYAYGDYSRFQIPEFLGEFSNLEVLRIFGSYSNFPQFLLKLPKLIRLELGAHISVIPKWIGELHSLRELSIWGNFTTIPNELFDLKQLIKLSLDGHRAVIDITPSHSLGTGSFKIVPNDLKKLTLLKELNLSGIMTEIPEWIGELSNLQTLKLGGHFKTLPETIKDLKLKKIGLWCVFSHIPSFIFEMNELEEMVFTGTPIIDIPAQILELTNLRELYFDKEFIQSPPPEILEGVDNHLEAIRNYYQELEKDQDHVYEAKLLILGEGGAGKTTLANKIQDDKYELTDEHSTEGIDVTKWEFELKNGRKFQVNIWDFGGQEIYHATHQFFLTNRSLYVVVADNRKEDTDFNYWLNVVELLGGESPVLIIQNEKKDRKRQIGEPQLRARFSNITEIIPTNFADNRGLDDILSAIQYYMKKLPHVGSPLPKSWVDIRHHLERDPRNHIPMDEYREICTQYGLADKSNQDTVMGFLHDLGVCLHFRRDHLLKRHVILKPHWGTTAVYAVLDNQDIIDNFGRFSVDDLHKIWHDSKYDNMHDELLRLMMNFKLCYPIPDVQGEYIAPQLLTEHQPVYSWNNKNNVKLRYKYEFMPKGLVTRLIVAMHRYITDDLVWKTGVLLNKDFSKAEIVEHYSQREIHICLVGSDCKVFLGIIMHELDRIHDTFRNIKYDRLIPCNCIECANHNNPHYYPFEVLQNAIHAKSQIQCQLTFKHIDPEKLLDAVIPRTVAVKRAYKASTETKQIHVNVFVDSEDNQVASNQGGQLVMKQEDNRRKNEFQGEFSGDYVEGNQDKKIEVQGNYIINTGVFNNAPATPERDELKTLLEQLQEELNKVPEEQQGDAEAVAKIADNIAEEAAKPEPNKTMLTITGDGLKKAAENLKSVAPIARDIALILVGMA